MAMLGDVICFGFWGAVGAGRKSTEKAKEEVLRDSSTYIVLCSVLTWYT